jgi:hypothetical protein
MTTLRVRLSAPPAADRADAWALFDGAGRQVAVGRDPPAGWPAADRVEYVVGADRVRIATTVLPPMPAARVAAAAGFALEDQWAAPAGAQFLVTSAQAADGRVRVIVADRDLVRALAAGTPAPERMIAEPELAAPIAGWRWCVGETGEGFVRCADGFTFPVGATGADGALPPELALALTSARRDAALPQRIEVNAGVEAALTARWTTETGIPFAAAAPWRWADASPAAFAAAAELLPEAASAGGKARAGRGRLFVPAVSIVAAALLLHVLATVGEWAWLKAGTMRESRAWEALAASAGIPPEAAGTPEAARSSLARRHAELLHAQGLTAPGDALPLLARAAPALSGLPQGALKSATYADGHWTLELQRLDPAVMAALDPQWKLAGLAALTVATAAGQRVRFGLPQ